MDQGEQKSGTPLHQDWIVKAEYELEALRKRAELERDSIRKEFHAWPKDDVRRWTILILRRPRVARAKKTNGPPFFSYTGQDERAMGWSAPGSVC